MRGRQAASRRAHIPVQVGSTPAPASSMLNERFKFDARYSSASLRAGRAKQAVHIRSNRIHAREVKTYYFRPLPIGPINREVAGGHIAQR